MDSKIILSICIPTFNRCDALSNTIESIVLSPAFHDGKIEIVISDNASTDKTQSMVEHYCNRYKNIRYHRNDENNGFLNIITVLKLAKGELCKLHNDYLMFTKGALEKMFAFTQEYSKSNAQIFFSNGSLKFRTTREFITFDEYIRCLSFWCSFVGGYFFWKNDLSTIKDIDIDVMFPHTSLFFNLLNKDVYIVNDELFFQAQDVSSKGGYNLFDTFGVKFLNLLSAKVSEGRLNHDTFQLVKKEMLLRFLVPWHSKTVLRRNRFTYDLTRVKNSLLVYYSTREYYQLLVLSFGYSVFAISKELLKRFSQYFIFIVDKFINPHSARMK